VDVIMDKMKGTTGDDITEALNKNLDSWNKSQEKFRKEDLRSWELARNLHVGSRD
jgi:hypothetical protein